MDARFSEAGDPIVGHIERLPVNAAHRTLAHAEYRAAQARIGHMFALLQEIGALVATCRGLFRMRKRIEY